MALANADRCLDLAALDLFYHSPQENGVKFIPRSHKIQEKGTPIVIILCCLPRGTSALSLNCYMKRSKNLRSRDSSDNPLFISVHKPHKPVKPATIRHWIKGVMNAAGIDTQITQIFSAHSTQGAVTSKANAMGVSSADILKSANWSSVSTFCRFYHTQGVLAAVFSTTPGELQTIPYCKVTMLL